MKNIRHGDISLKSVTKCEGEIIKHNGSFVVAEGETTGHKHVITTTRPEDLIIRRDKNGDMYFELLSAGTITHEEHKTLEIPAGIYKESREQEYDYFGLATRRVID